ncbi:hypothetical protein [Dishui Lake phycodnavirus 4]|nr:hypothetical protein [Dishui Lake phycodnavirus 4]
MIVVTLRLLMIISTILYVNTPIPSGSSVIRPGEIIPNKEYSTPNGKYYLLFRDNKELVWMEKGKKKPLWRIGANNLGDDTVKASFENNGSLCLRGSKRTLCEAATERGVLVLRNTGHLYIESGENIEEPFHFYPKH